MSFNYRLTSLITHVGPSPNCGHYTAIGEAPNGSYYRFDDMSVNPTSVQNVLNTSAYVIFYEMTKQTRDQYLGSKASGSVIGPQKRSETAIGPQKRPETVIGPQRKPETVIGPQRKPETTIGPQLPPMRTQVKILIKAFSMEQLIESRLF